MDFIFSECILVTEMKPMLPDKVNRCYITGSERTYKHLISSNYQENVIDLMEACNYDINHLHDFTEMSDTSWPSTNELISELDCHTVYVPETKHFCHS